MGSDLGDDGRAKGHVGDEVAVHDIDVKPGRALLHDGGTGFSQSPKVGTQQRGSDDGWRRHGGRSIDV